MPESKRDVVDGGAVADVDDLVRLDVAKVGDFGLDRVVHRLLAAADDQVGGDAKAAELADAGLKQGQYEGK